METAATTTASELCIGDTLVDYSEPSDNWYHATVTSITAETYAGMKGFTVELTLNRNETTRAVFMVGTDRVKVVR